jgi:neurotransmitter:Na+ symporter, NSS family
VLYVLFIILAAAMIFVPGTGDGYKYIFTLDPKGLLNPEVWVYAFGQCFFSLSVAGSGSVIYGAYLGKDINIRKSALLCAIFDTSAALLAMFIIIPAMASVGESPSSGGPGLLFIYLIPVFNSLGGLSRIVFILFYVAVLFAGVSSIINLLETPVAFLQEKLHFKRLTATAIIHALAIVVALMIQPWTSQWMDMVSIYLCPLGAASAGIMYFWVMKKETALEAVQLGDDKPIMKWFHSFGKYAFVPLCLLCFVLGIAYGGIG